MNIIRAGSRGAFKNEWLDSRHSFSFGEYYDPNRMGFSTLRVINEDWVAAKGGFPTHGHRDMEIITYVMEGALSHKDSLGNGSTIRPGDVQRMSAGRGILHSEFNHSTDESVHLLQIWILPKFSGIQPGYAQAYFPLEERRGKLQLVASADGREDSLSMNTDASLYASILEAGQTAYFVKPEKRAVYVHVARGELLLNGEHLQAGDAAEIREETELAFSADTSAEFLLFDLP
ncbi:MAG: pirin family protein [Gammaproteobacteria bacterium]|nr:pirin family protein [Gammaproteobacteria bacterium]MBU1725891.1 pirin family protein [Gammaproteobacteria bacterium]MBU2006403.1 pirin family protein [Gammaproteobacteria bacterium]